MTQENRKLFSPAANLRDYLEHELLNTDYPIALEGETEPQYTARVLLPKISELMASKVSDKRLWIRGDGAATRAYARTLLGFRFHPDLALGEVESRYWCAEVKLSRGLLNGDVISKALGQALIYSQVFPMVTILIIDAAASRGENNVLHVVNHNIHLLVLSRML